MLPDFDEEPDFDDEPDLEVFDLLYVPVLPLVLVPCLPLETEPVVLLRTEEVLPELLVLVTLPEETVEDFFAVR